MARGINKPKQPKVQKQQKAKATARAKKVEIKHMSVGSSWGTVTGSAPWVSGQSSSLSPGSKSAAARRRYRATGYKARTKKVIRPRITKRRRPDK